MGIKVGMVNYAYVLYYIVVVSLVYYVYAYYYRSINIQHLALINGKGG